MAQAGIKALANRCTIGAPVERRLRKLGAKAAPPPFLIRGLDRTVGRATSPSTSRDRRSPAAPGDREAGRDVFEQTRRRRRRPSNPFPAQRDDRFGDGPINPGSVACLGRRHRQRRRQPPRRRSASASASRGPFSPAALVVTTACRSRSATAPRRQARELGATTSAVSRSSRPQLRQTVRPARA